MAPAQNMTTEAHLDVYGCEFTLGGDSESAIAELANDFRFFDSKTVHQPIRIQLCTAEPAYELVPAGIASTYTPRNVSLTVGDCTYIDYHGRALAIWDRAHGLMRLYATDPDLLYEAAYLFMLSRIGEFLDQRHTHRIHAMAVSLDGRAVLAILPMGGGKSTLCSQLLNFPEFCLLSDDSPFVGPGGEVLAFPLRLGLLPGHAADIPAEFSRTVRRMEFGPKILVSYDYFAHRVCRSAEPGIVFIGQRSLARECRVEPASRWQQLKCIVANCVVGLGLFQGLEFVLTGSPWQLLAKTGVAWSRFRVARRLFRRSRVYRLTLGRDHALNAATVRDLAREVLAAQAAGETGSAATTTDRG